MPLNESKLFEGNGTRDEALQRPDRATPKPTPKHPEPVEQEQAIAPSNVQATQAQEDAAKALDLAVQAKASALQDAAMREASQATEEIMVGMAAYASTLLQGTEAMVQAKAAIREGLNQAVQAKPIEVDFSNFFRLKTAVNPAIGGENS